MFLTGGTAFSGTTLLALLLTRAGAVCLDEPDFHDHRQRHRGLPVLQRLFPGVAFPDEPVGSLSHADAAAFLRRCEAAVAPRRLGMKTCGWTFVEYAKVCRAAGEPVVAIVRDIRDVLVGAPLAPWMEDEGHLVAAFRVVARNLHLVDLTVRYEDLVANPEATVHRVGHAIGHDLDVTTSWASDDVDPVMFKYERHDLLRAGRVTTARVGLWRTSDRTFSEEIHATAEMLGYGRT